MRSPFLVTVFLLVVAPYSVRAADPAGDATGPEPRTSHLTAAHARVSSYVGAIADRIDGFFVDPRIDEEYNRSRLRLQGGYRISEADDDAPVLRGTLNLRLPRSHERLSLILSGREQEEFQQPAERIDDDEPSEATLRYVLIDRASVFLNLDGSVGWDDGPQPRIRLRARREWPLGTHALFRLTPSIFWERQDGYGTGTRVTLDRRIGKNRLIRWRNEAEISRDSEGVEFGSGLIFSHQLDEKTGYRLSAGVTGQSDASQPIEDYRLTTLVRRRIHSNWLFVVVEPRIRFPRERSYDFAPEIILSIEALFGEEYVDHVASNESSDDLVTNSLSENSDRNFSRMIPATYETENVGSGSFSNIRDKASLRNSESDIAKRLGLLGFPERSGSGAQMPQVP